MAATARPAAEGDIRGFHLSGPVRTGLVNAVFHNRGSLALVRKAERLVTFKVLSDQ